MVTEQPQYSVVVCIFHILQNTEIQLISNDLRLIFTCSLLLASPCIFHAARHSWATIAKEHGIPVHIIGECLGHMSEETTRIYLKDLDRSVLDDVNNQIAEIVGWQVYIFYLWHIIYEKFLYLPSYFPLSMWESGNGENVWLKWRSYGSWKKTIADRRIFAFIFMSGNVD